VITVGQKATTRAARPPKRDRWLIGALATVGLFYLFGKAMGLGQRRGGER